jgi:hypothetical protein
MDMSARGHSRFGVIVWVALDEADPTSRIRSSRHKFVYQLVMGKMWQWLVTFESNKSQGFKRNSLDHALLVNQGTFRWFEISSVLAHALYDLTSNNQH